MKQYIFTATSLLTVFLVGCSQSTQYSKTEARNIKKITELYRTLEVDGYSVDMVDKFFDKSYIQDENGVIWNYDAFVEHVKDVKHMTKKVVFLPFEQIIANEDLVIVRYKVRATLSDGSKVSAPMIAIYQLNDNGMIVRLWEAGVTSSMVKNSPYIKEFFSQKNF